MIRGIGFRAQPKQVDFAVLEVSDEGEFALIADDSVVIPKSLDLPFRLTYLRTTVGDLLAAFKVDYAGIRVIEGNSDNKQPERIQLEAVIQEALAGSSVRGLFAGRLGGIAARIPGGYSATRLKAIVASGDTFTLVPEWPSLSAPRREAILVGMAALAGRD